jgi:hypothetical protein
MGEKRIASRYAIPVPVTFLLQNGDRVRLFTQDVSAGGLFVRVDKSLRLDNDLRFLITFPREITTSCKLVALCNGVVTRREATEDSEGLAIKIQRYQFLNSVD